MQFRPGVVTGEEITKWNQREEYPNGYFQTSAIDCAGKNDVVLKFQHLFRWNNWFTGKRAGLWVGVSNDGVNWKEYNVMDKLSTCVSSGGISSLGIGWSMILS